MKETESPLKGLDSKYRDYPVRKLLRTIPWDQRPPVPDPAQTSAKEFFAVIYQRR